VTRVELDDRAQGSMVGQVIDAFFEGTDHVWSDQRDVGLPVSHGITYVTGPSGCGKSAMLRAVLERDATWTVLPELPDGIALVDQFAGSLGERIAFLAQFGLGDAQVLIRETSWLSDGQRFRVPVDGRPDVRRHRGAQRAAQLQASRDRPPRRDSSR